jgi:hypothetical protein
MTLAPDEGGLGDPVELGLEPDDPEVCADSVPGTPPCTAKVGATFNAT